MLRLGLLLALCTVSQAQVPGLGSCPKVEVMQNFNLTEYLGLWYEEQKYFAVFEIGGKCITANYSMNQDGSVKVVNRQISTLTGSPLSIEGFATFTGNKSEAKLSVVFTSLPLRIPAPYWVLDTDYTSYSVVFSCTELPLFHIKFAWILARERNPPVSVIEKATKVLEKYDKHNLSDGLLRTDQKNCP